ncbi:hypothetical protein [Vibrio salinus]|uniref:hypothetical protein n=1 Tax=Vibrio salinus TaxID=2899784 RepID=UPI001E59AB48|nr:hypothetical protein [Vibrio salinus]MCE0495912.1 hypothetical protein [Vibrio salinus]
MSEDNYKYNTEELESVMLFTPDKDDAAIYVDDFSRLSLDCEGVVQGGVDDAIKWVKSHAVPSAILVDIDGAECLSESIYELCSVCGPTCKVVAIGTDTTASLDLYRNLLAQGVFDYLVKPVTLDRFANLFNCVKTGRIGEISSGRTIAVTGVKGGIGTSLIVLGIAQILSNERRITTGLVDFDRTNGCLGLLCGLQDEDGLSGVLRSDSIDTRFLYRSMNTISDKLSILSQAPDYFSVQEAIDQEHILTLGSTLCQMFKQVVWDLPSSQPDGSLDVLACAHTRIIVADYTVISARNTLRLLKEIGDETDGQRIVIVCNEHRQNSRLISRLEFEQFINRKVDIELPFAGKSIEQMLLKGALNLQKVPLFNESISSLVDLICGYRSASKGRRRLFQRFILPFERKAS